MNATFNHPLLRVQYRKRWSDPWLWDAGTCAIGPYEKAGGNKVGSASFVSYDTDPSNREAGASICPLRNSWFVRIVSRLRQPDGSGTPQRVYWTGYLAEPERTMLGAQSASSGLRPGVPTSRVEQVNWTALGLGGLLANLDLHRVWHGCGLAESGIRALEGLAVFGAERRPDDLNRSGKRIRYAHRSAGHWSVHDLLYALLDWHLYEPNGIEAKQPRFPHWPAFEIAGLTDALEWPVQDVSLDGNLLDAFAAICHPRRGLFFTATPPGISANQSGPVQLVVQTFAKTAITIPLPAGGAQTIPANTNQSDVTANTPESSLVWAPVPAPRRLTLHGHRDVRIVSLRWSRDGDDETAALERRWNPDDDSHAGEVDVRYTHVYRTWGFRTGWDGACKGLTTQTLPHQQSTAGSAGTPDAAYGAGGLTGATTTSGSDPFPEFAIGILDQIPMPSLATNVGHEVRPITDWLTGTAGITLDLHAPPLRPMVFVHHRSNNTWERLNVDISFPDARTLRLGNGPKDAAKIKAKLSLADDDLVLTCAITMPSPLAVSYIPDVPASADVQVGADRKRTIGWAERIVLQSGTVLGLTTGTPDAPATDLTVHDDLGLLRATLALARLGGERSAGATLTDTATMRTGLEPGQFVARASVPSAANYLDIGYLITSIRYDPTPGPQPKTIATIEAAQIDLEVIP